VSLAPLQPPVGAWPEEELETTACPACRTPGGTTLHAGLRDRTFFAAPGEWRLVLCPACGSGYLNPRPTPAAIGNAYSRYFTHDEAPGGLPTPSGLARLRAALANGQLNAAFGYHATPATPLGRAVAALAPSRAALVARDVRDLPARPHGRLLDVGSGSGAFLARMTALGWKAEGVEPDDDAVAVSRDAGLKVTHGTVFDVPSDRRFDAVTLSHVIEHLHDPAAVLARIHGLLEPGGTLWIATPNLESLGHRRFRRDWLHLDAPRHLVLFTTSSLHALLHRCGFTPAGMAAHAPAALASFTQSAAIAAGRPPTEALAASSARSRALAMIADRLARRDRRYGEELVVWASRST
jgi:SAM-dependent methyltransferase